ncbi:hypothetical protein KC19_8G185200 [Ceratodon purpureus]|uniref:Guanosine nucleotide diphosphate dissociation inhibitor n=1 Tax=Ceratodon purpureus TaxID=3225 RepID=A0A8T0H4U9_CERPU|nr:hypothetical protein KC19_8G185200 [Ceratodon purpureus]
MAEVQGSGKASCVSGVQQGLQCRHGSQGINARSKLQFMMANGALVRVLVHTDVTKYLLFKAVDGSFVYKQGKIYKVPSNDVEAVKSTLMGLFEKRRARNFFIFVQSYDEEDSRTHEGMDLRTISTKELFSKYGLDDNTIDFVGHSLALHRDDRFLLEPALDTVKRVKLYAESMARFQGGSPYIYPLYGLGELPQAFARLSAVHGGTYMLGKPDCKVRRVGKVVRAICFMSHPIPNTDDIDSVQIILPQKQLGRRSDMYVFCCSHSHNVAPRGKYIAFVSAEVETDAPEAELEPGLALLGLIDERIIDIYDMYEPVNESSLDNCFISKVFFP